MGNVSDATVVENRGIINMNQISTFADVPVGVAFVARAGTKTTNRLRLFVSTNLAVVCLDDPRYDTRLDEELDVPIRDFLAVEIEIEMKAQEPLET